MTSVTMAVLDLPLQIATAVLTMPMRMRVEPVYAMMDTEVKLAPYG